MRLEALPHHSSRETGVAKSMPRGDSPSPAFLSPYLSHLGQPWCWAPLEQLKAAILFWVTGRVLRPIKPRAPGTLLQQKACQEEHSTATNAAHSQPSLSGLLTLLVTTASAVAASEFQVRKTEDV